MATTGSNGVLIGGTTAVLAGATVATAPFLEALNADTALAAVLGTSNLVMDRIIVDQAQTQTTLRAGMVIPPAGKLIGGFALNGFLYFTMTGTTAVTVDFTNIAAAIGVTSNSAGDATCTTMSLLTMRNVSASASTVVVIPAASNPLTFPLALAGTSPSISLLAGDVFVEYAVVGKTVDSTHKGLTFTPTAGGAMFIAFGGV